MPNAWFRCYSEFSDDPKVQMMPEHMQRRLIMLFCERCKEEALHESERAFHWRVSVDELAQTKALFIEKGFIDEDWELANWDKRQFLSDSSAERVRRHRRLKKQPETLHVTKVAVTVTAPDTDTDTEQTQKQIQKEPPAVSAKALPADRGKLLGILPLNSGEYEVRQDDLERDAALYPGVDVPQEYRAMKAWLLANPRQAKTARGIRRFMNSWLARAQDRAKPNGSTHPNVSKPSPAAERLRRSIAGIQNAGHVAGLDEPHGADERLFSERRDTSRNSPDVDARLDSDRGRVWGREVPGRVAESPPRE